MLASYLKRFGATIEEIIAITRLADTHDGAAGPQRSHVGAGLRRGRLLWCRSLCTHTAPAQRQGEQQCRVGIRYPDADRAQAPSQACQSNHKGSLLKPCQAACIYTGQRLQQDKVPLYTSS